MYMQVVGVLVVILTLYYAAMIALDIQKQKAAKAAEQEKASEVDIDISDEAETFKPVLISRDEPAKVKDTIEETPEENCNQNQDSSTTESSDSSGVGKWEKEENAQGESDFDEKPDSQKEPSKNEERKNQDDAPVFIRPGYREPVMTDGVEVEELINQVNKVAETGQTDLGLLVYRCESARNAS